MKIFWLMTIILIFSSFAFSQEARKIDEVGDIFCDDYLARMDNVRLVLNTEPSSKIYFLIYEGKERVYNAKKEKNEIVFPAYGSTKARVNSMKQRYLLYNEKHLLERIVFIKADFRENFTLEIWSVPNGATPPKPTPTLKKMKYRKGKPKGFCVSM